MTARPRNDHPRAAVLALVLALHALLLWHWPAARPGARHATPAPAPLIVALRLPPPVAPAEPAPAVAMPRAPTPMAAAPRAPRRATPPRPDESATPAPVPEAAAPVAEARTPSAAADEAAPRPGAPLQLTLPRGAGSERGALGDAPGSMRRAALNDPRSNIRPDPTRVLPDAVAASAKGDCMKGEFAGGGMGLLSLPFLAAAALRGDCKPVR